MNRKLVSLGLIATALAGRAAADVLIEDDHVVQGGACVGIRCPSDGTTIWNNGNFEDGRGELRLRDDFTLLTFEDTSTPPAASRSWQLRANRATPAPGVTGDDAERFELVDLDAGTVPLRIDGPAPDNAIVVNELGFVGFGTAEPLVPLHLRTDASPQIAFEQGPGLGDPYRWTLIANRAGVFVVDDTAASVPLTIAAGAPNDALHLTATGHFGIGTATPAKLLHLRGESAPGNASNDTSVLVENVSTIVRSRRMLELSNNGAPQLVYTDTSTSRSWQVNPKNNSFIIARAGYGGEALAVQENGALLLRNGAAPPHFNMQPSGNLTISGTLTQGSDVHSKHDIVPLDGAVVLARLEQLPVSEWTYNADAANARHAGPMAQDFHAAFGLGDDPTRLAPGDVAGVALAAVKAQQRQIAQLSADNAALQAQLAQLLARLERIEGASQVVAAR